MAFYMRELTRRFFCGDLNEDLIKNVDETHFVINMDNGKILAYWGNNLMKYMDVVVGHLGMTMIVCVFGAVLKIFASGKPQASCYN